MSPEELLIVEELWITDAQSKLIRGKSFKSLCNQLNLFLDEKDLQGCKMFKVAAKYMETVFCDDTVQEYLPSQGRQRTLTPKKSIGFLSRADLLG